MKNEIEKILNMVQEGKIDAEKAAELIEALKERETDGTETKPVTYGGKMLKIRVNSHENDQVSVNLPVKLVKVLVAAGVNIASSVPDSEKYMKDVDVNLILEAIENDLDGKIVDIQSKEGDIVTVTIE